MTDNKDIRTYSVIPSYIMYDNTITPGSRLLYGTITNLSNWKGYCFATNRYLADLFGITTRTIGRYLSELEKRGYVETELIRKANKEVEERRIWITEIKRSLEAHKSDEPILLDDGTEYISWMIQKTERNR